MILVADPGTPWSEFCLRHADRVVALVGDAPVPSWVREQPELRGCDVLLVDCPVATSAEWLDALEPRAHHRIVRPTLHQDAARAGRRLAGCSVGLVLSGGGARALAHIGVIEELLAAGIEIDRVGGCSMGAFVGAMFALGMEPDEIDEGVTRGVKRRPLNDYHLPRYSIIRGERVGQIIERNLPGQIEEMPLDYFCVTADLLSGEQVVHRRGTLYTAVGTACRFPGWCRPTWTADRCWWTAGC